MNSNLNSKSEIRQDQTFYRFMLLYFYQIRAASIDPMVGYFMKSLG